MKILISIAVSLISGALFFFTIPEGNILEIGIKGILFSFVFGLFFSFPFILFCTFPAVLIVEAVTNKKKITSFLRLTLYICLTVILVFGYRYFVIYWTEEINEYAIFGPGIICSTGYWLGYTLFEKYKKRDYVT